jgi:hypothetical protein
MTWIDGCLTHKGDSLSPDFVGIALGWLQQYYCKAEIWVTMTNIPTKIMTVALTMESIFMSFVEGRMVICQVPKQKQSK